MQEHLPLPSGNEVMELTMQIAMMPVTVLLSNIEANLRMTELIWGNLLNFKVPS